MSNFLKKGLRKEKVYKDKVTKKHIKSFYQIIGKMDEVAKQLDPSIEYTEENINEYVNPIFGRDLDGMEKMLVLGKMHHKKDKDEN